MSAVDDFTAWDQAQFLGATVGMNNSYDQPVTGDTVTSTLATQGQNVSSFDLGNWSGFFQGVGKTLLGYSLAKDQMETQAEIAKTRYQTGGLTPIIGTTGGRLAVSPMLLIGAGLVLVLLLKK